MKVAPSIAIVYDHLTTQYGGAEVVLQALLELYPEAKLYSTVRTLTYNSWLGTRQVHTTFLQLLPTVIRKKHQLQALVAPIAIETLSIPEEIVISVSAGVAKGVLTRPDQLHICYLLTPTRYLYEPESAVLNSHRMTSIPGLRQLARLSLSYLRKWDMVAATRVDCYFTISKVVTARLQRQYSRTSSAVLYPPYRYLEDKTSTTGNLKSFAGTNLPRFLFSLGRHVWYKRVDSLVHFSKIKSFPTIIAGSGAVTRDLHSIAGSAATIRQDDQPLLDFLQSWSPNQTPIAFVGQISDQEASLLFSKALCFIMPGIEDFGLTGLEALSAGCPLIVHKESGVAELLTDQQGVFLSSSTYEEIDCAVSSILTRTFSPSLLKKHALRYSEDAFKKKFSTAVEFEWIAKQQEDHHERT